jgi:hypothetical protein
VRCHAQPDGEAILAFSEERALHGRSALHDLEAMQQAVTQALRRIEIEVLQVVTSTHISGLNELQLRLQQAESALESLSGSPHVIDAEYIDRFKGLMADAEEARRKYSDRWRELFQ